MYSKFRMGLWIAALASLFSPMVSNAQKLDTAAPLSGLHTQATSQSFDSLVARLEKAIALNKMGLVAQASASKGAAGRGIRIRGNTVLMVFRNDYAGRMLAANVAAGIEAPLRLYATEEMDGTANVAWRSPSVVFAPYRNSELDVMARELDPIFEKIIRDATSN